jgi:hypothetical protein
VVVAVPLLARTLQLILPLTNQSINELSVGDTDEGIRTMKIGVKRILSNRPIVDADARRPTVVAINYGASILHEHL